ncbi:type II toxin-antitoxin system PemK/MazF family toxin [Actinocrinis sp.]|uniref:type II toxin-antitoxin system PemK/MazF family toxin n=1 Tax=Actinocrinis sp. TaxID=1920516 RepID=UPI002D395CA5|nr:type II toxin-antitoxin system PemK/MazF family toxin [Actinocrinis sp.]HZP52788.1 type II toxin-antitoxin system PemK/MazF family toxin [Actinocrinis sp.]
MTELRTAYGHDPADPFADSPGRFGATATVEIEPTRVGKVHTTYAPNHDGDPDPGEIVWTWVPFEEHDGRGKDRPVLIVAREHTGSLLAVQLTSKRHDGTTDFVDVGTGPWDREGRESWVNLERVVRVYEEGMRRESCAMHRHYFDMVVERLHARYGWS